MVEYDIVCTCGNVIKYSSETYEEKVITCNKCGKQIKVLNYSNRFEVHFL